MNRDQLCIDCGRTMGDCDGYRLCRMCAPPPPRSQRKSKKPSKVAVRCERCDRITFLPLDEDGECHACQTRDPEVTPEEIETMKRIIRAENNLKKMQEEFISMDDDDL